MAIHQDLTEALSLDSHTQVEGFRIGHFLIHLDQPSMKRSAPYSPGHSPVTHSIAMMLLACTLTREEQARIGIMSSPMLSEKEEKKPTCSLFLFSSGCSRMVRIP